MRVFTSQPLEGLPSQSAKPAAQAATLQAPTAQRAVALGRAHARPQAPQSVALSSRLTSQPLTGFSSQSAKPAAQRAGTHAPAEHPCVATCSSAQTRPHAPQLVGSFAVLAHQVVAPSPQVVKGPPQVAPQTPPEHTCPAAQDAPHAPQLAALVRVSTSHPLLGARSQSAKPGSQARTAHAPAAQVALA